MEHFEARVAWSTVFHRKLCVMWYLESGHWLAKQCGIEYQREKRDYPIRLKPFEIDWPDKSTNGKTLNYKDGWMKRIQHISIRILNRKQTQYFLKITKKRCPVPTVLRFIDLDYSFKIHIFKFLRFNQGLDSWVDIKRFKVFWWLLE